MANTKQTDLSELATDLWVSEVMRREVARRKRERKLADKKKS